jgi:hypothetical protein
VRRHDIAAWMAEQARVFKAVGAPVTALGAAA